MKNISILLIGSGNIALEHYRAFSSFEKFHFVGVVARNKKKLSKFAKKIKISYFSTNVKKAYIETKPDLVIVAVSITNTFKICKLLSKFNSTIFVEKPLGYNYEETKKISKLFKNSRSKIFVALNRRNYSSTITIKKNLNKNYAKRVIIVNDQANIKNLKSKFPKKILENFMYANSIHLIDYFNIFCRGNLKKIKTFNKFDRKPFFVNSILYFSSGDQGIYSAIFDRESPWFVSVFAGEQKYILKPLEEISSSSKIDKKIIKFSDDKNYKPGFKLQAKQVLNYFMDLPYNLIDEKEYLKSVELIKRIYK
tara:strand:+ start:397 stop:1323 length:927 start_codon:yes stop_codon:yes gene_type:complete